MAENLKPRVNFKSNKTATAGFKTQIVPFRPDEPERMGPDDTFKPAGPLQGGELRRAALAHLPSLETMRFCQLTIRCVF